MSTELNYQQQAEARFYAELREHNPWLPDPKFVPHGTKLVMNGGLPILKIGVYVNLPETMLAAEPEPEVTE